MGETHSYVIYDIEVLPNIFTMAIKDSQSGKVSVLEVSEWKNDINLFRKYIRTLGRRGYRMVGFNSFHYDYPVIHSLFTNSTLRTPEEFTAAAYKKSKEIIGASKNRRFDHVIWDWNMVVPQVDLFKIHHFDNGARRTSLKRLEFNMRMDDIVEFGVDFDKPVDKETRDRLIQYNIHDIEATTLFFEYSREHVQFRESMIEDFDERVLNWNDAKIGEQIVISKIKKETDYSFFEYRDVGDDVREKIRKVTERKMFNVDKILFNIYSFNTPEFKSVYDQFREMTIYVVGSKFHWSKESDYLSGLRAMRYMEVQMASAKKAGREDIIEILSEKHSLMSEKYHNNDVRTFTQGVEVVFGKGGLHASGNFTVHRAENGRVIRDIDVASLYPSIAIEYGMKPAHLPDKFTEIYSGIRTERFTHDKGTVMNKALKLSLNGTYGKSNSKYSSMYDPLYTMQTTLNGQMMLAMLWDRLVSLIDGIQLIQINTDGITYEVGEDKIEICTLIERKWEEHTRLQLESASYKLMFVRDVNNYIALTDKGKLKLKGAYNYLELFDDNTDSSSVAWHKNHSAQIIKKAAVSHLVYNTDIRHFIENHQDLHDFFLCTNVGRKSRLMYGDTEIQRNTRYLISKEGEALTKVMPPLPKNPTKERYIGVSVGWKTWVCNTLKDAYNCDINYEYYVDEAQKLVNDFR